METALVSVAQPCATRHGQYLIKIIISINFFNRKKGQTVKPLQQCPKI